MSLTVKFSDTPFIAAPSALLSGDRVGIQRSKNSLNHFSKIILASINDCRMVVTTTYYYTCTRHDCL